MPGCSGVVATLAGQVSPRADTLDNGCMDCIVGWARCRRDLVDGVLRDVGCIRDVEVGANGMVYLLLNHMRGRTIVALAPTNS